MRTGRIKVLLSIAAVLFMCTMFNCNAQAKMNVTVSPAKLVQNAKNTQQYMIAQLLIVWL